MTTQSIELRSSLSGTTPIMFESFIGLAILGVVTSLLSWRIDFLLMQGSLKVGHELNIFSVWWHLVLNQGAFSLILPTVCTAFSIFSMIVSLLHLVNCFYYAHWVNIIDLDQKRITERTYRFPLRFGEQMLRIDRILEVDVQQSSLQRFFNVGTIEITYLRNENFESTCQGWLVQFIEDPMSKKRHLEELISQGGTEQIDFRPKKATTT